MTARTSRRDAGFTMVELLIAMALMVTIGVMMIGSVLGARSVSDDARLNSELTADVRRAMERLVRELRQAGTIDRIDLPTSSSTPTAITFWADFDEDGIRDVDAADPEVLTYRFTPGQGLLTLTVNDAGGTAVTTPVLADNVTAFNLDLRSSQWQYDRNADGLVGWSELDVAAGGVGNSNNKPDGEELTRIDSVVITVSVYRDGRQQQYRTQVDFRNRHTA